MLEVKYLKYVITKEVYDFTTQVYEVTIMSNTFIIFNCFLVIKVTHVALTLIAKVRILTHIWYACNMAKMICIFYCLRMCIVMYVSQENIQIKLIWNHNGLKFILKYICTWYIILEECINNVFYLFSWFYFLFCRTFVLRNTRVFARSCATSS